MRHPSAHRDLIALTAWSGFAARRGYAALSIPIAAERSGFLIGLAMPGIIGVALIALAPAKAVGTAVGRNHSVGSRTRKMGAPHALLDANQGQVIAANLCRNTSSVLDKSLSESFVPTHQLVRW